MALTKASRSMLNTGISDSSDATALTFSSAEDATFAGHVVLGDNKYLKMGASNDLLLVHDGSNSYIIDNGTGNLVVAGSAVYIKNAAYSEQMISAIQDAQVELYYNNSLKLATASDGIDVTGHIDAATITTTGAGTIGGNLTVTGNLQVDGTTTTINSTTYTVDDLNITLASGAGSSSAADGAGITIDGASATWNYVHSDTSWTANKDIKAPRFLQNGSSNSTFYAAEFSRSGSGSSPDIWGTSNVLVLGYAAGSRSVTFNSSGADFAGTITSAGTIASGGNITAISASSPTLEIKDTTNNVQFKAYAQDSNAHLGTISNHSLIIDTNNTAAISIDSSQNTTISNHLIVDGNTTLGNADTDTVTVPGPLAVDTDTLYVDVTNDRVSINSGTSPSTALDVTGVISTDNIALGGATVANGYLIEASAASSGNIIRSTRGSSVFAAYQSNNSHVYLGTTSDNEFRIIQNDGTALTIDTDRNVGIGTTSPNDKLHIKIGTNLNWQFGYPSSSLTTLAALNDAEDAYVEARIDALTLNLNSQSGGNVSIGTTTMPSGMSSSSYKQFKIGGGVIADSGHASGHNLYIGNNVYSGASNDLKFTHAAAASTISMTGGKIYFRTHDGGGASADATASLNQRMLIHNNGRVRIGDSSTPGALLDIGNITNQYPLKLRGNLDSSGGYSGITFGYEADTNAYEKARIRVEGTSGNVQPEFHILIDHEPNSEAAEKEDAIISVVRGTNDRKTVVIDAGKQSNAYDVDLPTQGEVMMVQGPMSVGLSAGTPASSVQAGRYVHHWWQGASVSSQSTYTHIETNLWGGGSPSGNTHWIMGGFWIKGYRYATNANLYDIHQFHNWSGSLYNYTNDELGSWTGATHCYVSSNGWVTLRLDTRASYRNFDVDLVLHATYGKIDMGIKATTLSANATI